MSTIAQAFNQITAAQGGTPDVSGSITGAIDALNDALAGSDQPRAAGIAEAVTLLGEHIGGGGGSFGRMGTVSAVSGGASFDCVLAIRASKTGSNIAMGAADGSMSVAMGAYVVGATENGTIQSATYKVSDSGTPQECEIFSDSSFGATVFGFVMPDVTENDYPVLVDVTFA